MPQGRKTSVAMVNRKNHPCQEKAEVWRNRTVFNLDFKNSERATVYNGTVYELMDRKCGAAESVIGKLSSSAQPAPSGQLQDDPCSSILCMLQILNTASWSIMVCTIKQYSNPCLLYLFIYILTMKPVSSPQARHVWLWSVRVLSSQAPCCHTSVLCFDRLLHSSRIPVHTCTASP